LQQAWDKKKNELRVQLGNASIAGLKTDLERLTAARSANNVTLSDQETCAGKLLASAAEIDKGCAKKRGEIGQARDALRVLQDRRPSEAEKNLHRKNLDVVRAKAREAAAAFTGVDELRREPTKDLQAQIGRDLDSKRRAHAKLTSALLEAEKRASDLGGQLKTAQPHRPLGAIAAELDEAREALDREETLQEARVLLRQRIETKMETLAAHVPVDLGNKVTQHLARLTGGVMGRVVLGQELAVTHVGENGAARLWQPGQLSHGERHQAALAVKIAVARALAETSGPVFIVLDDSLVSFDPRRRAATENFLLDLVKDGKLQVIVLTCHTDWAGDWSSRSPGQVRYVELTPTLDSYYRVRS
jgi:DNA repair exonuclease SbcCD ATPase subunit